LYGALACGRLDVDRLRTAVTAMPVPRAADGQLVLAVDATCCLRPDAHTSPERILCHTYGRGKDQHIMIPGWPYSFVVALETGRSSWTAPLDAVRLAPGDDAATVTAAQLRDVVGRLMAAGHWQTGDPDNLVVADADGRFILPSLRLLFGLSFAGVPERSDDVVAWFGRLLPVSEATGPVCCCQRGGRGPSEYARREGRVCRATARRALSAELCYARVGSVSVSVRSTGANDAE
jgi:hypothetical protein